MSYHWLATQLCDPAHKPRLAEIEHNRATAATCHSSKLEGLLKDKDLETVRKAMRNRGVTEANITHGLNHEDQDVRLYAAYNPSATEANIMHGLNHEDSDVRRGARYQAEQRFPHLL